MHLFLAIAMAETLSRGQRYIFYSAEESIV